MTKKLYVLITSILGAIGAAASAIVAYIQPSYAPAVVMAIGIAVKAVDDIIILFVKVQEKTEDD